jgi:hypothetical protein
MEAIKTNLEYIRMGNIGCTFASVAAKFMLDGKDVGWEIIPVTSMEQPMPAYNKATVSFIFPKEWTQFDVEKWCLGNGMRSVIVHKGTRIRRFLRWLKGKKLVGLRIDMPEGLESWVMYFGQDAHCPTRKTPYPMVTFRAKKPKGAYEKVGFNGKVIHIAQMMLDVAKSKMDRLWKTSHKNTEKIIGKKPNEVHAAKTTFIR